jgi:hypothetical protein
LLTCSLLFFTSSFFPVYRQTLVKLPRPEFIVLYNGSAGYPDKTTLRLSDAFELVEGNAAVNLELKVEVYNIGKGHNEAIVRKSRPLSGYVDFVHTAEESRMRIKLENPGMMRDIVLEKQFRRLRCSVRHGSSDRHGNQNIHQR